MRLKEIISKIEKRHSKKIDLSLNRTFNLLKKLGNPQNKLNNVVTVVGTNSKASMATALSAILKEAGYKYNLYTSPHLQSYTERFIFNDKEINKENLVELLSDVEKILGNDEATLFEILTCAYLKYAESYKNNINIIEAGLFHQFDSTNVFKENLLTLIGYINLDHIVWLKNKTIDGIIYEKTTKLLNSNIFVNQQENSEISLKIKNALNKNLSNKFFFGKDFNVCRRENSFIQYQDHLGEIIIPEPNLLGDHQLGNISTSIAASRKLFNVKDDHIKKSVTKIELKGRLQEIKSGKLKKLVGQNRLIVDGGHNIGASKAISNWIKNQNQDVHIIVGMMKDKSHKEFIDCFKNIVKSIQLVDIPNQKGAISKEEFKNKLEKSNINISLANSIEESLKSIAKYQNSIGICTGSLYLTGEVLNLN